MERYGNTKTALELTPRAAAIYADSDPLEILERGTPDGLRYDLHQKNTVQRRDDTERRA